MDAPPDGQPTRGRRIGWIVLPTFACALAALVTIRRRRARRPDVTRVSDAWLRDYEYAAGHHAER